MRIVIHNVDHGGCTVVTGPAGHRLMLDCGLNSTEAWFPSIAYRGERIDTLMLMNLDEDHCEDLSYLWDSCPLGAIFSNPTVDAAALRTMKAEGGMRSGVAKAANILGAFGTGKIGDWSNDLGGVKWNAFWNRYGIDFVDTNNLSLAVFVQYGGFTILFGGDLLCAGWKQLLTLPAFCDLLRRTNVYVASHHGRDNGRCEEMFEVFRPSLIIFSDGPKEFESQETLKWYGSRAVGLPDYSRQGGLLGQPVRRVMTTRDDGSITIDVSDDGQYVVTPSKGRSSSPSRLTLAEAFSTQPLTLKDFSRGC